MVPSIAVMPRDGSFALAFFGRMRKVQESAFSLSRRPEEFRFETDRGFGHFAWYH